MSDQVSTKPTTKICSYCQTVIPLKATKCSQCHTDLRSFWRRHPLATLFFGLPVLGIILSSFLASLSEVDSIKEVLDTKKDRVIKQPTLTEELTIQLQHFNDGSNDVVVNDANYESIAKIQAGVLVLNSYADLVNRGQSSKNLEDVSLAKKLKVKVIENQVKLLPQFRKLYSQKVNSLLSVTGVEARVSGVNNLTLELTGDIFVTDANISDIHVSVKPVAELLRFKKVNYKTNENTNAKTFTISSKNDTDLVLANPTN